MLKDKAVAVTRTTAPTSGSLRCWKFLTPKHIKTTSAERMPSGSRRCAKDGRGGEA